MTTRPPNFTHAFDDPMPGPYPELEEEVHEMYLNGGTSIASLSAGEDLEVYRKWLSGFRPLFFGKPERWCFRGDTYLWDERLHGQRFATQRAAKDETIDWMLWYNRTRLHSTLAYVSPMQFEENWLAARAA